MTSLHEGLHAFVCVSRA